MSISGPGLGTQLRMVIAKLDGDVQALYDSICVSFRPRFFPVVQCLIQRGPCTITSIARIIGVSQPAATQTIAEMAKLRLVNVVAGIDGRERLVSLTAKGGQLSEQLQPLWDAVSEAAEDLNRELPCSLTKLLTATLEALCRESFADRVRRIMNND